MLSAKDEAVRQEVTNRHVYVILPSWYGRCYYAVKHDKGHNKYDNDQWGAMYPTIEEAFTAALSDWEVPDDPIIHYTCWEYHNGRGRK